MIARLLEILLKERGNKISNVEVYFSKLKMRRVVSIEFTEEITYDDFLKVNTGLIKDNDINLQDSYSVGIDLTEDFLNRILNITSAECKNEMEQLKK